MWQPQTLLIAPNYFIAISKPCHLCNKGKQPHRTQIAKQEHPTQLIAKKNIQFKKSNSKKKKKKRPSPPPIPAPPPHTPPHQTTRTTYTPQTTPPAPTPPDIPTASNHPESTAPQQNSPPPLRTSDRLCFPPSQSALWRYSRVFLYFLFSSTSSLLLPSVPVRLLHAGYYAMSRSVSGWRQHVIVSAASCILQWQDGSVYPID